MALDPIIAQALGARDELAVARGLQRGLVLSVVLAIPISLLMLTVEPVLDARRPARGGDSGRRRATSIGSSRRSGRSFAFIVLRQTLQAHRRTGADRRHHRRARTC